MDEWMTAYGLTGRMKRSAIPLTLMTTTLMDHSGGDGRMIYICPVCPWTVEYKTSELVASGVEDCALEVEQVLADHLHDPGCHWEPEQLMVPHGDHTPGSMAAKLCDDRRMMHDRRWQQFLAGDLEADGWWL